MTVANQIPAHMLAERRLHILWTVAAVLLALLCWFPVLASLPLLLAWRDQPFSLHSIDQAAHWFRALAANPLPALATSLYGDRSIAPAGTTTYALLLTALLPTGVVVFGRLANPYRATPMLHGDARFATRSDIMEMERRKQVGPNGPYLHLGLYGPWYNRVDLALIETLSVLLMAPPGAGKTVAAVVPAILRTITSSMLVYDPKPELWQMTSGFRATLGPTYRLDWSQIDRPHAGSWNPQFNFLDPRLVPLDHAERETFVDALVATIIPSKKNDPNDHFTNRGRSALSGFIHFIIARVNDRTDKFRYEGLPRQWHGHDASLSMLVSWLTATQSSMAAKNSAEDPDPMKTYLQSILHEVREHRYPDRCALDLQGFVMMDPRERSGVISTLEKALSPFKHSGVMQRTRTSDFIPTDLRGVLKETTLQRLCLDHYPRTPAEWAAIKDQLTDDDWQPLTIYISINQAVAAAFATLTTLFFEICAKSLLAYGPGETTSDGTVLGPYSVGFIMDEFAKLPPCDAVISIPELGRSKALFCLFAAQDKNQVCQVYSPEQWGTLVSSTAIKLIFAQNNTDTIREIVDMVNKTTIERSQTSRQVGLSLSANPFAGNQSKTVEGVNLINPSMIGSMRPGRQIVIAQNFVNRPAFCKSPFFFRDPVLRKRAWNLRKKRGIPPATRIPLLAHHKRSNTFQELRQQLEKEHKTRALRHRTPDAVHYMHCPRQSP